MKQVMPAINGQWQRAPALNLTFSMDNEVESMLVERLRECSRRDNLPEIWNSSAGRRIFASQRNTAAGEDSGQRVRIAEGATRQETLRQKDCSSMLTLESDRNAVHRRGQVAHTAADSLRSQDRGATVCIRRRPFFCLQG